MKPNLYVVIRRKLDDKIAGFLKSYFFLDDGSACLQAVNTFQEATKCDRDYAEKIPIDWKTNVLFGHLQDNLQDHYNISITPINREDGTPDFLDREYFDGKYPISRGEWQHYFHKLAEECEDIRHPQENDIFYYKAEAEDTIWDEQGNYKPNFIYKPGAELNFSQYVQLAYDSNQQCFAIIAATKDSDNAVQFYNRGGDAKPYPISLYTKAAIETIANMMNWHDDTKYYSIPGQRFVEEGAIVFNLKDATEGVITTKGGTRENDDE